MIPVGYMVWDTKAGTPYKYTRTLRQVFTTEAAAMASRGHAEGVIIVPVTATVPLEASPMVIAKVCKQCGYPKERHPYRHPFVPA